MIVFANISAGIAAISSRNVVLNVPQEEVRRRQIERGGQSKAPLFSPEDFQWRKCGNFANLRSHTWTDASNAVCH